MKKKKKSAKKKKAVKHFELEHYQHPDIFGRWLGYEITAVDPKKKTASTRISLRADHLSPAGRVHGGVISAFMDFACGAALFPLLNPKAFCSTVELKVNYFRPLDLGNLLTAETKVVFLGKRLAVIHGYVYRKGEKEPVAMATATYNVVPPKA